jgi:hypothetical protein
LRAKPHARFFSNEENWEIDDMTGTEVCISMSGSSHPKKAKFSCSFNVQNSRFEAE